MLRSADRVGIVSNAIIGWLFSIQEAHAKRTEELFSQATLHIVMRATPQANMCIKVP